MNIFENNIKPNKTAAAAPGVYSGFLKVLGLRKTWLKDDRGHVLIAPSEAHERRIESKVNDR